MNSPNTPFAASDFATAAVTPENAEIASYVRPAASELVVAGPALRGSQLSFIEFLSDPDCRGYCLATIGEEHTAAGLMAVELLKGTDFPFFGLRAGKFNDQKAATRRALKEFARLAYRGDPQRRPLRFWTRVAGLLWKTYAALIQLREDAEKIKRQEDERIARIPEKRARNNAKVREWRKRRRGMIV